MIRGRGGGDQPRLYKYNSNLLHLSTLASLKLSPAAWIAAGGKLLSARETKKSAGGKSFFQRVEEVVRRQKEKGCYSICTMDMSHSSLMTSKPTLLQIMPYVRTIIAPFFVAALPGVD